MMIPLNSDEVHEIKTEHHMKWLVKRSKIAAALFGNGVPRGIDPLLLSEALDRHAAEAVAIELGLLR